MDCVAVPESVTFSCPNNSAHSWFLEAVKLDWGVLATWMSLVSVGGRPVGCQRGLGGAGRNEVGVVRSLNALRVYTARTEGKQAVAPRACFLFTPFHASPFLGAQDWYPLPAVLFCSVLQIEAAGAGKQAQEMCSDATITECLKWVCTSVLLYCHWRKMWLGGKTANFQGSFLRGKLLKTKQYTDSLWCWL